MRTLQESIMDDDTEIEKKIDLKKLMTQLYHLLLGYWTVEAQEKISDILEVLQLFDKRKLRLYDTYCQTNFSQKIIARGIIVCDDRFATVRGNIRIDADSRDHTLIFKLNNDLIKYDYKDAAKPKYMVDLLLAAGFRKITNTDSDYNESYKIDIK